MNGESVIRIAFDPNFEGVQIKRGTLFEEFLYELFLVKSFFFSKSELGQNNIEFSRAHRRAGFRLKLQDLQQPENGPEDNLLAKRTDYLCFKVFSSETVSFFLPFLLREAKTLRPLADAILSRKPCLFFLFLFEG